MHETALIATIAAAFVFAFAFGLIASWLRLPPLVGYLLAVRRIAIPGHSQEQVDRLSAHL